MLQRDVYVVSFSDADVVAVDVAATTDRILLLLLLYQVAGSASGVSAFQMDIKVEGITLDIMKQVRWCVWWC